MRPSENEWSVAQIVHHLYLTEKLVVQLLQQIDTIPEKEVKDQKIHYMLHRAVKVKAPSQIEPTEESMSKEQLLQLLDESRNLLLQSLEAIEDKTMLERKSVPHPILGEMKLKQWVESIPLHEKRHIEQIKEVIQHIQNR